MCGYGLGSGDHTLACLDRHPICARMFRAGFEFFICNETTLLIVWFKGVMVGYTKHNKQIEVLHYLKSSAEMVVVANRDQ